MPDHGIFPHKCFDPDCETTVEFDDEPWCFTHSPEEGSSVLGFSAEFHLRAEREAKERLDVHEVIAERQRVEAQLERKSDEVLSERRPVEEVPVVNSDPGPGDPA